MSENLITHADFVELTGAIQPAKQCEVLRQNGIKFTIRADGKPSLTWEAYNRQLSSPQPATPKHLEGPKLHAV